MIIYYLYVYLLLNILIYTYIIYINKVHFIFFSYVLAVQNYSKSRHKSRKKAVLSVCFTLCFTLCFMVCFTVCFTVCFPFVFFLIISLSLILALLQALCPDIISSFELFEYFCVTTTSEYEKLKPSFWLVL